MPAVDKQLDNPIHQQRRLHGHDDYAGRTLEKNHPALLPVGSGRQWINADHRLTDKLPAVPSKMIMETLTYAKEHQLAEVDKEEDGGEFRPLQH